MKNLALLLITLLTIGTTTYATEENNNSRTATVYDGSKYIFLEDGIEFSVFPDGEFDFYIPRYADGVSVGVSAGPVSVSFNTGFDYDPYIQYDDYGAVIQIEDTPLYYDNYGRLTQAGSVDIRYRRNRIRSVGGLYINYNTYGAFDYCTGFINVYNRTYVYRPYHTFFYRPVYDRCLVWTNPYRRYYSPVRYSYAYHTTNYYRGYNNGYRNARRSWRRPETGRVAHNNGRRDNVDRNNARFQKPARTQRGVANNTNSRGTNRGIAKPRTTRGTAKPNNARGIAKPRTTRGTAKPNNARGIAKPRTTRGTAKPNNARGIAKPRTTRGSAKPNNARGIAKPRTTRGSAKPNNTRGVAKPRTARGTAKSNRSKSNSRGTARPNNSRGKSVSKRTNRGRTASKARTSRPSTSTRSKAKTTSRASKSRSASRSNTRARRG